MLTVHVFRMETGHIVSSVHDFLVSSALKRKVDRSSESESWLESGWGFGGQKPKCNSHLLYVDIYLQELWYRNRYILACTNSNFSGQPTHPNNFVSFFSVFCQVLAVVLRLL